MGVGKFDTIYESERMAYWLMSVEKNIWPNQSIALTKSTHARVVLDFCKLSYMKYEKREPDSQCYSKA